MPVPFGAACFTMANEASALSGLDQWLSGFGAEQGLAGDFLEELRVCLHEVVGNVILHGSVPGRRNTITVTAGVDQTDLVLSVTDDAMPFNPLTVAAGPAAASLEEARLGGLGLHLTRSFTDRLAYDRPGGHNRLTLVRHLCRP